MIRILALNEESHSSNSDDGDEPTVTQEAQVIILFGFKCNGKSVQN